MEKKVEVAAAKKRRAKLLNEFNRLGWTQTKFALKHKVSTARMWLLLKMAVEESGESV